VKFPPDVSRARPRPVSTDLEEPDPIRAYRVRGTGSRSSSDPSPTRITWSAAPRWSSTFRTARSASLGEGFAEPARRGLLRVDPEILGEFLRPGAERRSYIPLGSMPRHLILAVVASEDRRFFGTGAWICSAWDARPCETCAPARCRGGSTISQAAREEPRPLARSKRLEEISRGAPRRHGGSSGTPRSRFSEVLPTRSTWGQRGSWSVCGVEEGSSTTSTSTCRRSRPPRRRSW